MNFSDEKLSVLESLETAMAGVWRANLTMTDYTAQRAYDAAFQLYRSEMRGHAPKPPVLSGLDAATFEAVQAVCEFRLGRRASQGGDSNTMPPISVELLVDCLRELVRSVERHTKLDGRQGYLTFIDRFVK